MEKSDQFESVYIFSYKRKISVSILKSEHFFPI